MRRIIYLPERCPGETDQQYIDRVVMVATIGVHGQERKALTKFIHELLGSKPAPVRPARTLPAHPIRDRFLGFQHRPAQPRFINMDKPKSYTEGVVAGIFAAFLFMFAFAIIKGPPTEAECHDLARRSFFHHQR